MITPIAGPWDSPAVVILNNLPKLLDAIAVYYYSDRKIGEIVFVNTSKEVQLPEIV